MAKGFSFNIDNCVACHACIVGCSLENGPDVPWRRVISDNADSFPGLPVHNILMACNHCEETPCMDGCPTRAYYRDELSGAVLIDPYKCIGCNYCFWNCPFDAPQYNSSKRHVEKCNLCHLRLLKEIDPACVTACPTGALNFIDLDETKSVVHGFPKTGIKPRLEVASSIGLEVNKPKIIPGDNYRQKIDPIYQKSKISLKSEWSLISFTFLSSLLFSFNISNWFGQMTLSVPVYIIAVILVLALPLFHLGKPLRSWRSVTGILRSPLSNEIIALLLFSATSVVAYAFRINQLWIVSFLSGFVLLVTIDSVYTNSDKRLAFKYHPGQVFFSGLIIASFMLNELLPFIVVALLKLLLSVYYIYRLDRSRGFIVFTILQAAVYLFIAGNIADIYNLNVLAFIMLLDLELASRVYYYYHFQPESTIIKYFTNNLRKYEETKTQ